MIIRQLQIKHNKEKVFVDKHSRLGQTSIQYKIIYKKGRKIHNFHQLLVSNNRISKIFYKNFSKTFEKFNVFLYKKPLKYWFIIQIFICIYLSHVCQDLLYIHHFPRYRHTFCISQSMFVLTLSYQIFILCFRCLGQC